MNKKSVARALCGVVALTVILLLVVCCFTGCATREADIVSYNLSLEADNFNNVRQITVINRK